MGRGEPGASNACVVLIHSREILRRFTAFPQRCYLKFSRLRVMRDGQIPHIISCHQIIYAWFLGALIQLWSLERW